MSSMMTATLIFAFLVLPIAGLITHSKPGCDSLLQRRENPANADTIEGEDCGNTQNILAKWKKSKNVGNLIGTARAAVSQAEQDAENLQAALTAAEELGESVGRDGEIPKSVSDAVATANTAKNTLDSAASTLGTATDTLKGKVGNFAADVTDADMVNIKKLIDEAQLASVAAKKEGVRVNGKADAAVADTMKSSAGALRLITGLLDQMEKLNVTHKVLDQKTDFAMKAVEKVATDSEDVRNTKLPAKITSGGDQKPVWEAYKHDLDEQEGALGGSKGAVSTAHSDFNTEMITMTAQADALQAVKDASQSSANAALGKAELISAGEAAIRAYDQKKAIMIAKVGSMQKNAARYTAAVKNVAAKLAASPVVEASEGEGEGGGEGGDDGDSR